MKNITPLLIGLVIGALVGSFLTNVILSTASATLAREKFYAGFSLFCHIAPPPPGSSFANMYSDQECTDLLRQAKNLNYFEQNFATPAP